jgi:hypothetical protein
MNMFIVRLSSNSPRMRVDARTHSQDAFQEITYFIPLVSLLDWGFYESSFKVGGSFPRGYQTQ